MTAVAGVAFFAACVGGGLKMPSGAGAGKDPVTLLECLENCVVAFKAFALPHDRAVPVQAQSVQGFADVQTKFMVAAGCINIFDA
ncbi:hypothetical protein ATO7_00490 [Oceanococcus atlanticus]|uniref:Uncharacterized protein n=1 Tax=Oceanococcus atlanticus TaxID=1317117 RepID=A0A1Y1SF78_9GAMM|nr:hypothetical protein ATO7_00490 [Oceanococcus atlanticus]